MDRGRECYGDVIEIASNLGIKFKVIPTEAPWQLGMVERHGGVFADLANATIAESGTKGYSPRAFVFGLGDRLVASNLNHFLEQPDDASVEAHKTDPTLNKARQLRKIAMIAVIELDHSDKWIAACKYP